MGTCPSQYYDLFVYYMSEIQNICTSDDVGYAYERPIPIYDDVSSFLANTTDKRKGIFVKDLRRYYQGEILSRIKTRNDYVAMFIVPEFGETQINHIQFLQNVVISFDSFIDVDPLGEWQIRFMTWFINKHNELLASTTLDSGTSVYTNISTISKPILNQSDQSSAYVRRSIVVNVRYCNCG